MENAPNFLHPASIADIQKKYSFFRKRYEEFYHHTVPSRFLHIIGDSLLIILILFFGSYAGVSYVQQKFFSPASAKMIIILPGDIMTVGMPMKFLIRYENTTRVPLRDARITFQFHPLFTSATSSQFALNPETRTLELGTIEANQEKEFVLSGVPFGALGDVQTLSGELSFQSNKKEGREHIPSFVRYAIQKGALAHLSCAVPSFVTFYQIFDHECTVLNISGQSFDHVSTKFSFSSSYTSRSRAADSEYALSANEGRDISHMGFFQKEGVGAQTIIARTYLSLHDTTYLQDETRMAVRVLAPALSLYVRYDPLQPRMPGKTYSFVLHWKNESAQGISDARIRMFAHGDYVQDKEIVSFIKFIQPSKEGDITFTLALDKKREPQKESTDHLFQMTFEPSASYINQEQQTIKVFAVPVQLDISSDISVRAFARYYTTDGEQIGRGPLPPRVGKTTRYSIFLAQKNSIHAIENFTVTAQLGPHASWTGIVPIGSDAIRYYPEKKELVYLLSLLPSIFNASSEESGAVFELAFTPTSQDIGIAPTLLQNIRATGRDSVTHMPLEFNAPDITTDVLFDSRAKSIGGVVK
ncbi:hypothetical protein HYW94_00940 [Candidatus Uhrbacteria bacterium]|nr:hypothetical protein [Candidatus Uhrbacteria bacterium]